MDPLRHFHFSSSTEVVLLDEEDAANDVGDNFIHGAPAVNGGDVESSKKTTTGHLSNVDGGKSNGTRKEGPHDDEPSSVVQNGKGEAVDSGPIVHVHAAPRGPIGPDPSDNIASDDEGEISTAEEGQQKKGTTTKQMG